MAAARRLQSSIFSEKLALLRSGEHMKLTLANLNIHGASLVPLATGLPQYRDGRSPARALAEALAGQTAVLTLDLSSNALGLDGAQQLAAALRATSRVLRVLSLDGCALGPESLAPLAETLTDAPPRPLAVPAVPAACAIMVATLGLSDNALGPAGAALLARVLAGNTTLVELRLARNGLGLDGAAVLAAALPHNRTLRVLDIAANTLGQDGVAYFARAVAERRVDVDLAVAPDGSVTATLTPRLGSGLEALHVADNGIGSPGIEALLTALRAQNPRGGGLIGPGLRTISLGGANALGGNRLTPWDKSRVDALLLCNALRQAKGASFVCCCPEHTLAPAPAPPKGGRTRVDVPGCKCWLSKRKGGAPVRLCHWDISNQDPLAAARAQAVAAKAEEAVPAVAF